MASGRKCVAGIQVTNLNGTVKRVDTAAVRGAFDDFKRCGVAFIQIVCRLEYVYCVAFIGGENAGIARHESSFNMFCFGFFKQFKEIFPCFIVGLVFAVFA